ncbi:MAG: hypothetical protein Q7R50_05335 [Dehalococcoidales bacterium]|nr:hypothetical protein [Dehalococcoidales bacterium]
MNSNVKVKELSVEELKSLINDAVDNRLEERFGDPDVGLEVKPSVIDSIRKSRRSKTTIQAVEVAKRLGLKW